MSNERATVSIVKGDIQETPEAYTAQDLGTVREMIEESLDLVGGLSSIIGAAKTVVVKPNLVEVPFKGTAGSVVTDPRVLEALVGILKGHGVERVLVAEGKSVNLKHVKSGPKEAFETLGLGDVIRRAIHTLGNLVGNTATHEIGHSLGLPRAPECGAYHNAAGDRQIMDCGADRPFEERAELTPGSNAVWTPENRRYLEEILPLP